MTQVGPKHGYVLLTLRLLSPPESGLAGYVLLTLLSLFPPESGLTGRHHHTGFMQWFYAVLGI